MSYQAPYKDMQWLVEQAYQTQQLGNLESLQDFDLDLANAIMDEANKFASGVLAPLNMVGDEEGCKFSDGQVTTPTGWKDAYAQFRDSGWIGLALPEEFGGQGLPKYIAQPVNEMWLSSNLAFVMFAALAQGGSEILLKFASDELKARYLTQIVTGEWTVAMALTEPNAGSDLGALTTKAIPQADGTYQIKGQKIYITYGEHDMADNIVHLVLARTPDAPAGSRGISLFAVPKYRVNEDGSCGEFNDIRCTGIEHKTGLHGSPTCSISYGDNDACVGELIGNLNQGLVAMFVLMNEARLSCGMQGVGLSELAFQKALQYSKERVQGAGANGQRVAIIEHPDVKRMLLNLRSESFALRSLGYQIAALIDVTEQSDDEEAVKAAEKRIALLTPIFKGFATEQVNELAGDAIQVYGGMGFVEETGIAQVMRDARITTIYEGTTGVQSKDLVHRKIRMDQGQAISGLLAEMRGDIAKAPDNLVNKRLSAAVDQLAQVLDTTVLNPNADLAQLDAVAVPFLNAMGGICCAWQLARLALTAQESKAQDEAFFGNVEALAEFYSAYKLPLAQAALTTVSLEQNGVAAYQF
ncbi:Acyl-CoA dehydrogenase related to the alkylation response protein AidB [Marinomonas fungiae]|uniref:Acyl-CoA dehydrogenase related to the alkylation response protein AidB n=2 Tax=Marinomonas fungiae TaxID=1137284 RepID=A0A0K6IPJ6_9GAMM|nr:Acyl-CoA dehydrogenase related to the alkylation response protein AidB [Marinomonas fungiae]